MTTDNSGKLLLIMLVATITMCLIGSFVVSLDIVDFIYLIVLYVYIFLCIKAQKD